MLSKFLRYLSYLTFCFLANQLENTWGLHWAVSENSHEKTGTSFLYFQQLYDKKTRRLLTKMLSYFGGSRHRSNLLYLFYFFCIFIHSNLLNIHYLSNERIYKIFLIVWDRTPYTTATFSRRIFKYLKLLIELRFYYNLACNRKRNSETM